MANFIAVVLFAILTVQCSLGIPIDNKNNLMEAMKKLGTKNYQLIPPINDPLTIPDLELPFNLPPLLTGIVSLCSGNVTGLSTLTDNIEILDTDEIDAVQIGVTVDLAYAELKALYTTNVELSHGGLVPELPDYLKFEGQGDLAGFISNFKVVVRVTLPVEGKETIRKLSIDIQFDPVSVHLQDFKINDQEINWEAVSAQIKPKFDEFWGTTGVLISEIIRSSVNDFTKNCSLFELIEIIFNNGSTDCLTPPTSFPEPFSKLTLPALRPAIGSCKAINPTES